MRRLLIIGPCGAGKSTLARTLGPKLRLPVVHMDQLNWQPGWIESSKAEVKEKLAHIVAQDCWLIDGSYSGTLNMRLERADTIIYLDYPVSLCVSRLLRRIWMHKGQTRPDMTEGCPERFDFSFLIYLLRWNGGPRPRMEGSLRGHEAKLVRFKNPAALDDWMDRLVAVA